MFRCLCLEWILIVLSEGFLPAGAKTLVRGMVGQNITLPCDYSVERHGITTTCWGRGTCPTFKCADTIVRTDGQQVTFRQFSMYQLLGNIHQGDVALTIVNVTESATGTYCCRVEIRGLNNDQKTHVEVVIEKGNSDPTKDGVPESTWTPSTESPPENASIYCPTLLKEQRKLENSPGLYIGIGMAAILLFIIPGVILLLLKLFSRCTFEQGRQGGQPCWSEAIQQGYLPKNQKIIIFTRQTESSETRGIQHALESGIHVQENVYELN